MNHRDAGDPVKLASFYDAEGADELVFYDITASSSQREIMVDVVSKTADQLFIPLTVGGGLRSVQDMRWMLNAGADKVSINTAAVQDPTLIKEGADSFGSQSIVLGLDALRVPSSEPTRWEVRTHTGKGRGKATGIDAVEWAIQATEFGAGEIVVNSVDADGTLQGYDLELLRSISTSVTVPVVASGGAGKLEHLYDAISIGMADAILAASIFHFGTYSINKVKGYLSSKGLPVRFVDDC